MSTMRSGSGREPFSIVYARRALDDLDRILEFLVESDPVAAERAAQSIVSAVSMLAAHPLIGRPLTDALRALVVSFGDTGYVALYRVRPRARQIEVLSVSHQREAGFS